MSNVVNFPGVKSDEISEEQSKALADKAEKYFIEDTMCMLIENIFSDLDRLGFKGDEKFMKFFRLSAESLRAALYASKGLQSPLEKYLDDGYSLEDIANGEEEKA